MKHLIMGTAGHVDHGKTALVKALTGIECDTHQEEKKRGMTINLGFAHMDLPSGDSVGIVDVPGHRDFVHTMVGGASGIDFALLVIAADDGVMPQTREHLQIMDVLELRAGLVAVTKTDIVEPDIAGLAQEEARELVDGTFLEGCPILPVSATKGDGIEALKGAIAETAAGLSGRPMSEIFRLFVDRIFTASGFGTVVTGSVVGGSIRSGDTAYLLPGGRQLRVRRLERHGKEVDEVRVGDRASMNLAGLDRDDFSRGMIICDRLMGATTMLDAKLRLFTQARNLDLWSQVMFHLGTYEQQARAHLIDRDRLVGGETALVQMHLDSPCNVQYGDRFVIRSTSNDLTLGGGEVIDPFPLHHRRRRDALVKTMARIAKGGAPELVAAEARKRFRPVCHREIADVLNMAETEARDICSGPLPDDVVRYVADDGVYLVIAQEDERLRKGAVGNIGAYHRSHPLEKRGRAVKELMGSLGLPDEPDCQAALELILGSLENEGALKRVAHTWALADHNAEIAPDTQVKIDYVAGFLAESGMKTPLMSELEPAARKRGIGEAQLTEILQYMVRDGIAYLAEGNYLHASVVDGCREKLLHGLASSGKGMTVAQFRDLVGGNRKLCLLLFSVYDSEGVTRREGDVRVLTEKGRAATGAAG